MGFRYETHLHTNLVSGCSHFTPKEIVEKYTRLGYAGVIVTDHFFNCGTCRVPQTLSWEERAEGFFAGAEAVKKEAEGKLDVFCGFEYAYYGTDFLVYGLEKEWLCRHPEVMDMSVNEFCLFARGEGGLVLQAHPFREAFYIDHIRLFPSVVDGLETLNACRDERTNRLAENLANEYGILKTAGSDIHGKEQCFLAGMEFESRLGSGKDFCERIKKGEGRIFTLNDELYR